MIAIEIPAIIVAMIIMQYLGRRPIFGGCQSISGIACILAGIIDVQWLQLPLAMTGKFCATAAFMIAFIYTAEMYPTTIRGTAVGWSSMFGRIGGFLAPQVIIMRNNVNAHVALLIFV